MLEHAKIAALQQLRLRTLEGPLEVKATDCAVTVDALGEVPLEHRQPALGGARAERRDVPAGSLPRGSRVGREVVPIGRRVSGHSRGFAFGAHGGRTVGCSRCRSRSARRR